MAIIDDSLAAPLAPSAPRRSARLSARSNHTASQPQQTQPSLDQPCTSTPECPPITPVAPAADLPAELLARVLKLAQEGHTPPEQQQIRLAFERVCRAWYMCDNTWRVVPFKGDEQVEKLLDLLKSLDKAGKALQPRKKPGQERVVVPVEDIAARVETICVQVPIAKKGVKRDRLGTLFSGPVNIDRL